jgi:beta-phosphoglucomutase
LSTTKITYRVLLFPKILSRTKATILFESAKFFVKFYNLIHWKSRITPEVVIPCQTCYTAFVMNTPPHSRSVKAVIFDCDGTLVDSEHAHYQAWRSALQQEGGDLSVEEYYDFVGKPAPVLALALAQKIKKDRAQQLLEGKRKHYLHTQQEGHSPIQATVDFLHLLAKEKDTFNLKLGLASAATKHEILVNLRHLDIEHLFDIILSGQDDLADYSDPEGVNKPKPYIYLHAAKLLNLHPSECIVIEDSHAGVTAGVDAGCFTIAVPNAFTHHHDFSRAHAKIDSFANTTIQDFLKSLP